jgi:hypothetical protein
MSMVLSFGAGVATPVALAAAMKEIAVSRETTRRVDTLHEAAAPCRCGTQGVSQAHCESDESF